MADSVRSPDVTLALRFKNGFQVCEDIEDSKMHRKIDERTPSEYLATVTPIVSWASLNEAQRKCAAAAFTTPAATRLELCRVTQEQINLGRMSTGLTKKQLCQHLWGKRDVPRDDACVRVVSSPPLSLRFALWQNGKLTPIDDCCNRNVGVNALLHLKETICPISADWPAIVAAHVWERANKLGKKMPEITLSLDEVSQGYNNCPAETEQLLCIWDEKSQFALFFLSYVCGFGNAASVVSFCRLPELVTRFTARLFATFTRACIDDYLQPDFKLANNSSQAALAFVHRAIGVPLAACMHEACVNCNESLKLSTTALSLNVKGGVFITLRKAWALLSTCRTHIRGLWISPQNPDAAKEFV